MLVYLPMYVLTLKRNDLRKIISSNNTFKYLKCTYRFECIYLLPSCVLWKHTCLYVLYKPYKSIKKRIQLENTNCLRWIHVKKKKKNDKTTLNSFTRAILFYISYWQIHTHSVYYSVDLNAIRLNQYELRYDIF